MEKNDLLINSFFCPITQEIMENPVIAMDGISYEKKAIEDWFSRGKLTSPLTGATLENKKLIENINLRSMIRFFKESKEKMNFNIDSNDKKEKKNDIPKDICLDNKCKDLGRKNFEKSKKFRKGGKWKDAFECLSKSAEEGFIYSYFHLFFFLEGLIGSNSMIRKNDALSAKYYTLMFDNLSYVESRAKENDIDAILIIFNLYEEGIIYESNKIKAKEFGERGAKLNCPFCIHLLALFLSNDGDKRCIDLYNKSIKMGLLMSKNNLSYLYKEGYLITKDLQKYKEIQEELCSEIHEFNFSQYYYGCYYLEEEIDNQKAFYYLYKSAENGNIYAMEKIAMFYEEGIYVKQNATLTEMWKTKANYK